MTSRTVLTAGFYLILAAGLTVQLLAWSRKTDLPTIDDAFRSAQRYRFGRAAIFICWFWLGWHFLAR